MARTIESNNPGCSASTEEDLERRFDEALARGQLLFQRCRDCRHAWLPPRAECPKCLGAAWDVEIASGGGRLVSWVTYHRAYSPELAERIPYDVAVVELDEGPRLVSHLRRGIDRPRADARGVVEYVEVGSAWMTRFGLDR